MKFVLNGVPIVFFAFNIRFYSSHVYDVVV